MKMEVMKMVIVVAVAIVSSMYISLKTILREVHVSLSTRLVRNRDKNPENL